MPYYARFTPRSGRKSDPLLTGTIDPKATFSSCAEAIFQRAFAQTPNIVGSMDYWKLKVSRHRVLAGMPPARTAAKRYYQNVDNDMI